MQNSECTHKIASCDGRLVCVHCGCFVSNYTFEETFHVSPTIQTVLDGVRIDKTYGQLQSKEEKMEVFQFS
jgi:hypothetical protein